MHLLIIDDDALLRSMVAATLRRDGFQVSEADCGEQGLRLFESGFFHLVLLDVVMPGQNGFDICRHIRATDKGAALPILMLTSLADSVSIEQAFEHGATDFMPKPINLTLLSHRVRYAIHASTAAEDLRHKNDSLARSQRMAGVGNWRFFYGGDVECSAQLALLFGTTVEALRFTSPASFLDRVAAIDHERVRLARERLQVDGVAYQMEFQVMRNDGSLRHVFEHATCIFNEDRRNVGFEGITKDITERVRAKEEIRQLAHYDASTGLPNFNFFSELTSVLFERAQYQGASCAFLHIDVDRFKSINDAFGCEPAAMFLQAIAERLTAICLKNDLPVVGNEFEHRDVLAHVGCATFSCFLTDVAHRAEVQTLAQQVLTGLAHPIRTDAHKLLMSASIGIAMFPEDTGDLAHLARCARQACAAAQRAGGAQFRFFNESMNIEAINRISVESDLRKAIVDRQLRLHFQPLVDARARTLVGAEALVRWQHPKRGMVGPDDFVRLAEECGLIVPMTDWILESACASLQQWSRAGLRSLPLSINLATSSLMDTRLIAKLTHLMARFELTPACLKLEMTETMLMKDADAGIAVLERLRDLGYALSIDDFGTGYSSLGYLRHLPVHELKIDRAFVTDAARGGPDAVLAVAMIALGREFGMRVVAEGIETTAQSEFFQRQGCVNQQGYLFSRPLPPAEYETILRDSTSLFSAFN